MRKIHQTGKGYIGGCNLKSSPFNFITLLPEYSQACIHCTCVIKGPSVLLDFFESGVNAQAGR